jgi:nucleotide-binding universal stress UspA family protein
MQLETRWEFKRVLVAFDGSVDSVKGVKAACALVKGLKADLTILHAYSVPVYAYSGPGGVPPVSVENLETAAKEKAKSVLDDGLKLARDEGVDAQGEILESGSVVDAILQYAKSANAEMIVLGTRGMTGLKKALLGSVSSGVVSHAHCPVLVVR